MIKMKTVEFMKLNLTMGIKEKINLEKELGTSPLNFLFGMMGDLQEDADIDFSTMKIPPLPVMLAILFHATTKLNHGITREKFYDMIDDFLEQDGKSVMSLFEVVVQVLQVSRYIPEDEL
jgi:hypothetical protein